MKVATNALCLMSRTDYNNIGEQRRKEIEPYHDAFQKSTKSIRMVTSKDVTTIEIRIVNSLIEETGELMWHGIHELVSPGSVSYIEIHNFDQDGNTIDIEKYVIENITISTVKNDDSNSSQLIEVTGTITKELTVVDKSTV